MPTGRIRPLTRRYALGVAAVALPLLLMIGGVAATQFAAERAARLDLIARDLGDLRDTLEALVQPANDHVQQMRQLAEDHLAERIATPASPLRALLRTESWDVDGQRSRAVLLGQLAGTQKEPLVGNLHGRSDLDLERAGKPLEVDMALNLFEPMRVAHLTNPHLRWSYYFSGEGDFLVVYPFATGRDFMNALKARTFDEYLAAMYTYDVYLMSTPAQNPDRRSYWTPVYFDAGGAGWMVSHAAPVYVGDTFAGMVGTDILLDFLNGAVSRQHQPPGRVWIVDERGGLLADSAGIGARSAEVPGITDVLPGLVAALPLAKLLEPSAMPRRVGDWETMALPVGATPWHLVFAADQAEITALVLARLWPYALLLGGVLATLVLAQYLLQRFFVGPAIALAGRVQEHGSGSSEPPPARVPDVWRPWFAAVDEAFRSSRRHLAKARDEEVRKSAVLEAAFDSIITTDDTGRVLELNEGAENTFGFCRSEALGRPIGELIVPPHLREQHAQGIARYLATGERRVLGRRIEIEGQRADGSVFPVELAIAEVRLADRRLFTAYLRDITERRRAEQALLDSERRYRAVVEDQTELISRYDADFRLIFSNRAHARLFGVPEDLVGRDFFQSVPPELREPLRAELLALTPDRPIYTGENKKVVGNGVVCWFAWTNHALFDEHGHRVGYQCVGRDITDARQAEQALRESEARFLGAAESIPDGLLILDPEDRIVFYNSRLPALLPPVLREGLRPGIRFADWIGEGLARGPVYHPDMGPDYALRRLASRREEQTEREHKHVDGRWVRIREGRMPDGGRVLLTVDVTARREAEEGLKQSEARYRAVVEGQTEFIIRLRPDGTLTFVNDAYCRHLGLGRETLLGSFGRDDHFPTEQARNRASWAHLSPDHPSVTYEYDEPHAGGLRHEEWTDSGIFDERGQLIEIQSVGRDITERKQAEVEIRRQREAAHLREKLASLGSLLAGVAHELNNPLSVVVGRAIMLEDEVHDPMVRASLGRLRAAAERCSRIVKTFLALARDQPREARPVDVRMVLDAVLDLAYGLRSAGVDVQREDARDLPPVMADEDQLNQVFLNLLVNAQQALEDVPPPRRLWLRSFAGSGVVHVEVADNGPGVPVALRNRVLEPFFTTKPVGAGTGLGLSVCHGIVGSYGGTIAIDDRPGGGARFTVTLPAASDPVDRVVPPSPAEAPGLGGDVLVVDDEPEVVAMLEEVLAHDGHRVVTALNGAAALDLLRQRAFDVVLCDLRMPVLDGPGLAREVEAIRPDLVSRLLLMTGDALRAAAVVPPAARGRLLEKPLDPEEVRRRVSELVPSGRPAGYRQSQEASMDVGAKSDQADFL